jgi:tripartite-type tricarboxylate transporter receptor subunit TctC
MQRRLVIQSGLTTAAGMFLGEVNGQSTYPNKLIKMIIPLAAGSAVDSAARIVSQKMATNMSVGIAIDNQAGAAGLIGAERVAKSPPDGYTLGGFNDSIMTMLPSFHSKMPWDILRDFEPVSLVATVEWALVVPADSPIKTAADLIEAARKAPGKINYGSGGNGSPQHIAMALFAMQAGIQLTHVPYKGATQAAVGTAANEVQTCLQGIATVSPLVKAGKLRIVGIPAPKRLGQFSDIPTVSESGLLGYEMNSWFAVMAPAGTPKVVIDKFQSEVVKALTDSSVKEQFAAQGLTPLGTTPAELSALLKAQLNRYGKLIREAGITAS